MRDTVYIVVEKCVIASSSGLPMLSLTFKRFLYILWKVLFYLKSLMRKSCHKRLPYTIEYCFEKLY